MKEVKNEVKVGTAEEVVKEIEMEKALKKVMHSMLLQMTTSVEKHVEAKLGCSRQKPCYVFSETR